MSVLRLPRHRATSAQACVLFPAVAPGGDDTGASCLGLDVLGGGYFRFDPFVAYARGRLSNPNLLVLGEPGAASERMTFPVVALAVGFLVLIGYPALARVLAGF